MKKNLIAASFLALTLSFLPSLVSADERQPAPIQKKVKALDDRIREERSTQKDKLNDLREEKRGSSTKATSTEQKREQKEALARVKIFRLATGLEKNIAREIALVKNVISRLTGNGSVIAKLDAAGVNTTAIKAKLTEANTLADKAQTELTSARQSVASSTAIAASSSVQVLKARITEARKLQAQAHTDIKAALKKVTEARKLISQVPGLRQIETGNATSTATSSAATSTQTASSTN
jgi:hypothetical protein